MIDTDNLRRKLRSDDLIDHVDIHANVKSILTELLDRLDAVENENGKLLIALAERVASETTLRDLIVGNGSINATFEGDAVQLMVDALADRFVESGASNYIEMQFQSKATGPLLFTLQRVDGKTPHQLRVETEQEKERLLGLAHDQNRELIRLREECRALRAAVQHEADCVEAAKVEIAAMDPGACIKFYP